MIQACIVPISPHKFQRIGADNLSVDQPIAVRHSRVGWRRLIRAQENGFALTACTWARISECRESHVPLVSIGPRNCQCFGVELLDPYGLRCAHFFGCNFESKNAKILCHAAAAVCSL